MPINNPLGVKNPYDRFAPKQEPQSTRNNVTPAATAPTNTAATRKTPTGLTSLSTTKPPAGSLADFSKVMRGVSKSAYEYRQNKEAEVTGKQFDPTKVSGSIFQSIMEGVEKNRGYDISKVYGAATEAAKADIEMKEKQREFDIQASLEKESFYADHPELNYGFSGQEGMRTDRHMNPTAFTTDIAKQAGLQEGIDYIVGDPFPNNPNMFTAKLLGNPIETTIRVIDKIGFQTQGGQNRWTYTDSIPGANTQDWQKLSFADKAEVIKQMYRQEGGNGSIFGLDKKAEQDTIVASWAQAIKDGNATMTAVPEKMRSAVAGALSQTSSTISAEDQQNFLDKVRLTDQILAKSGAISGPIQTGAIPFTPNYQVLSQYKQLKGMLSLEKRALLKGSGAISDYEAKVLDKAASSLSRGQSEKEFKKTLLEVRGIFETAAGQETKVQVISPNGQTKTGFLDRNMITSALSQGYKIEYVE